VTVNTGSTVVWQLIYNASKSEDDKEEQEVRENDSGESSNTANENDDDINKDAIIAKKEKVDVKPIDSSNKKKWKRQLEVMQDTMKGLIKEVIDSQKASDQLLKRKGWGPAGVTL